jgi:tRNA G10  N-methylase Trm11
LPFPQIIRSDVNNHNVRFCEFFDAIVCDPPYGQRAFTKKSGLETHKKEKRQKRLKEKYADFVDKSKKIEEKLNDEIQAEISKEINENEEIEDEEENEITEEEFIKEINEKTHGDDKEKSFKWAPLKHCPLDQIFKNLMEISERCVKKGGYIVCLYPFTKKKEESE